MPTKMAHKMVPVTRVSGKVGGRIRTAREIVGLSADAFAKRIGVSASAVRNWEADRTSPTIRDVHRICQEFEFEPLFFVH